MGMNIYFSGIGGVGLGPLAEMALDAGFTIQGSDIKSNQMVEQLQRLGVDVHIGQDGNFLERKNLENPIDFLVYTAALPHDHPELMRARELGIRTGKRDELISQIISEKNLELIAVAGTHGKTTTTGMMVWTMQQMGIPVSYSVGATLKFAPSGHFDPESKYFIYECDEFDRNFLHFHPKLSLITTIDYDHPDTYPTLHDYTSAFGQFLAQSEQAIMWRRDTIIDVDPPARTWILDDIERIDLRLAGEHNRSNATLVVKAFEYLKLDTDKAKQVLEDFPGTDRRFEKIAENLYSDYGHHPIEISATLEMARELSDHIVLVYQPHQNTRQHQVRTAYTSCMQLAERIFWLPTYQTREAEDLPILTPEQLTARLVNRSSVVYRDLNDELWKDIEYARTEGKLVICMGAGNIDEWVRSQLTKHE